MSGKAKRITIGPAELWHGDVLEVLPQLAPASVDALITDPPYSSGGFTRGDRMAGVRSKYEQAGINPTGGAGLRPEFSGDNRDARSWHYWMSLWLTLAHDLVRPGGYCQLFSDWRQLPLCTDALQGGGFVYRGLIVWDKTEGARAPHKGYFRHQAEFVAWGTNGGCSINNTGPWPGVYREPVRQSDKHHITGKPTALMEALVKCAAPGAVVLDPFAGSGTTGVAAIAAGQRFIGVEKSAAYFEIARRRIEAAVRALDEYESVPA